MPRLDRVDQHLTELLELPGRPLRGDRYLISAFVLAADPPRRIISAGTAHRRPSFEDADIGNLAGSLAGPRARSELLLTGPQPNNSRRCCDGRSPAASDGSGSARRCGHLLPSARTKVCASARGAVRHRGARCGLSIRCRAVCSYLMTILHRPDCRPSALRLYQRHDAHCAMISPERDNVLLKVRRPMGYLRRMAALHRAGLGLAQLSRRCRQSFSEGWLRKSSSSSTTRRSEARRADPALGTRCVLPAPVVSRH